MTTRLIATSVEECVELRLFLDRGGRGFFELRLTSDSECQAGRHVSKSQLDVATPDLERAVMVCAGALAEHQCGYGDQHDPDSVARLARVAYVDMKKALDRAYGRRRGGQIHAAAGSRLGIN